MSVKDDRSEISANANEERRSWLGLLARAAPAATADALGKAGDLPAWSELKPSETGLVMVRGRVGGSGDPFNLGEMTVTRAVIQLDRGEVGVGYVRGRNRTHALHAALLDALLQIPERRSALLADVIAPLAAAEAEQRELASRKAAATKVEFFTMVRTRDAH